MNAKKSFYLLALVFLLAAMAIFPKNTFAQQSAGFSISPPSFEINALSGDTIKNTIKVENLSSQPLKFQVTPQNFVAYGEGGQVAITDEASSFSISNWISIKDNNFMVAPNSFKLVSYTIAIPKNAEPGSHYGAVVFSTVADRDLKGSGALLAQQIGSLILIKLPGHVLEDARLISFSPQEEVFRDRNITFNTLVENKGNIHIKPYGFINIYDIFGRKAATIEVKGHNILPGSRRLFTDTLKLNGIGFFRAEINLIYSGGGGIIKGEATFFALNEKVAQKYLIAGLIALVVYLTLRKRVNKALRIIFVGK